MRDGYKVTTAFNLEQANEVQKYLEANDLKTAYSYLFETKYLNENALWHYMCASYYYKRGWLESSYENYKKAYELEPSNDTYADVFSKINEQRKGNVRAFKKSERTKGDSVEFCLDITECCDA